VLGTSRILGQTAVWTGGGANQNFTTPGNWAGGHVPPNTGADTAHFQQPATYNTVEVDTSANLSGLFFQGSSGFTDYNFYSASGGTLTIGGGGISASGGVYSYIYLDVPIILSASQTWGLPSGYIYTYGPGISETGGPASLTTNGVIYMNGTNTFSGGVTVASGTFYAGSNSAAGTGALTLSDGTSLMAWNTSVTLPNAVWLGSGVTIGSQGYAALTLTGGVTALNASTQLNLGWDTTVVLTGMFTGPASTVLTIVGNSSRLPSDGGSLLVMQGALGSQVSGIDVEGAALILAPIGSAGSAYPGITASGIQVGSSLSQTAYLGLDGSFVDAGEVSGFLTTFGPTLGPLINGTLGFDTFANPASPNVFIDPIDLSHFTSANFIGLGSATAAILGASAVITPAGGGSSYLFGGGGGTLTVMSPLADVGGPTQVVMNPAPEPLTLVLQGINTYTGGTTVSDGVLIFDSALPATGSLSATYGYIGYTELAGVVSAQQFVDLFNTSATNGVIGFDSEVSPQVIGGTIDLSGFASGFNPFLGTSTAVTIAAAITPAYGTYQFTGVKGGQLTVNSNLSGSNSVVVGLPAAIEANGSVSAVTLGGTSNTYSGGTTLNSGILYVTNSSSLGTGALTVQNSSTLAASGASVTLGNDITLNAWPILGQSGNPNLLTLNGIISGYGGLTIESDVALNGANTFLGGSFIYAANVILGNASALGTGPVQLEYGSTVNEAISNPTFVDLTGFYSGEGAPVINLAPSSTLTLYTDSTYAASNWAVYSGGINGDASSQVIKTGPGTEYLYGTSTYGGGTTVSGGVLIAAGSASLGAGAVSVASGAQLDVYTGVELPNGLTLAAGSILGGTGTFSSAGGATFAGGAAVAPGYGYAGQYLGALSFANVTFGTGGIFDFNVQNAGGTAGADYSALYVSGSLTISATQGSPFQISVMSIDPSTGVPGMATFNPNQAYSWTLVSAGSISGFDPLDFSVNTSGFQNPLGGGSFFVSENGSELDLNFTPVPEPSTWILMIAGLATMGALIRKSRRTHPSGAPSRAAAAPHSSSISG
jgi:fibronectin-binding autotransporter adhesin